MAGSGQILWDRRCRVTIATPVDDSTDFKDTKTQVVEVDGGVTDQRGRIGQRIQFKVTRTLKKEPNTSEITISNLNSTSRGNLQKRGVKLLLEAGYKSTGVARYFAGDVRSVDHIRADADWESKLRLGDGERAWNFSRVSESFAPGTARSDVAKRVGSLLGIDVGNLNDWASKISGSYDQGFTAFGSTARVFDQIIKGAQLEWSIQDNALQILDPYGTLDLPIPVISEDSGMVGSPEMGAPKKKGAPGLIKVKSLLFPTKPGAKVKLKSDRYDGYLRVESVTFTGDTHGGDWYTEIDGSIVKQ